MERPADFTVRGANQQGVIELTGDWTAAQIGPAASGLRDELAGRSAVDLDLTTVGRMDTAGA